MVIRLLIATAFSFVLLAGCSIEKKINKAKHLLEDSGALAEFCADAYPVRDSIVLKDSVHFDTLVQEYIYSDTTVINDTVYITREVPKLVTKTVFQTKEVYRENTARLTVYGNRIKELESKGNECSNLLQVAAEQLTSMQKRDRGKIRIPIWWLLIAAAIVFRKPILKLIKPI